MDRLQHIDAQITPRAFFLACALLNQPLPYISDSLSFRNMCLTIICTTA